MTVFWTGVSFVFLMLVFRPLELAFPAKPGQRFFRPDWFTDLCFFLGQYLLWSGLVLLGLSFFQGQLTTILPSAFRDAVASQPWWLQVMEVIVLSDFCVYWGHRLQHRVGFLWRFHSSITARRTPDWLAAHREHPLDSIYTLTLINLPAFVLGFPLETLAGFIAFRALDSSTERPAADRPAPRPLGPGTPPLAPRRARRRQLCQHLPLMDVLFGTYRCPTTSRKRSACGSRPGGRIWDTCSAPYCPGSV